MLIEGILISIILIIMGALWGTYDSLRSQQVPRSISLIVSGPTILLAIFSIIRVLYKRRKDKVKISKKVRFAARVLPTAIIWVCDAVATIHERIVPSQVSISVQCKTLINKKDYIMQNTENDVKQRYQYAY